MTFHRRVHTIYAKELVDILRDRRTLIAMIVVPIVLYPLLMLGSIQAVTIQFDAMVHEDIVIGVINEAQGLALRQLIETDTRALEQKAASLEPGSVAAEQLPQPLTTAKIYAFGSKEEIEERIRNRSIHVGVLFDSPTLLFTPAAQNRIEILLDEEDVRSTNAKHRLEELISRVDERTRDAFKRSHNLPDSFDQPFLLKITDLSSPPSVLGQILPLILILMTITGAIYPAIDLTAGERERGTLESLMASPVPVFELIVGKFLVVTTVAIMGAALNLASVTATVYFGGFDRIVASTGGSVPVGTMVVILLCLIPFAVLMSAIMIAVCSFARTFKEAQNYVTPVILAVLIPGGIAALPATRLSGAMVVMPVGNMVLLARDLLLGAEVEYWMIALVLLSTTLYAGAAVAIAANVFGRESVVFADSGSLKAAFSRALIKPSSKPGITLGLLFVALLFPVWFFVQSAFSPGPDEDASGLLYVSGCMMPVLFVVCPVAVMAYWKVDVQTALAIRMPNARHLLVGVLLGLSAWVPAHELNVLQQLMLGTPKAIVESARIMQETLTALPFSSVIVLIALVPALCEELLFRGFLLSSLSTSARKWTAIIASALIFGVFHFFVFKLLVTTALGILLAYLCWQSRSIIPGIVAHFLHNALSVSFVLHPEWYERIGLPADDEWVHLPMPALLAGGFVFVIALTMIFPRAADSARPQRVTPTELGTP
ncbi:MAG: ABC transporter permease subunit/CPBP intramembrane protease [Phycisphaerae bacterium]|jgi:ABC-2 type transport system permease protein/sodium transport system permease protein